MSIILFSLASCGGKPEKKEATDISNDILKRAYVLSVVCYGEGLEYIDDGIVSGLVYADVSPSAPFQTKPQLENEIDAVFTKDLATTLKEICFLGQSGLVSSTGNNARYLYYSNEEFLKVYKHIEGFEIGVPDISKTEITKIKSKEIKGTVTYENGECGEFVLKKENGNWKLDSLLFMQAISE